MELAVSHEDSQILLKDKNILQDSVVDKYRTAGQITQTALKYVTGLINDIYHYRTIETPLTISELCLLTDSFIVTRLEQYYKNKVNERGIAIPTSIDVDQLAGGWSPEIDDIKNLKNWNKETTSEEDPLNSTVTGLLKPGDIVKITLGVHIDGYTSEVSHSMVIYPTSTNEAGIVVPTGPLLDIKADAVAASHIAVETVIALLACALTPEKLPATLGTSVTGQLIRHVVNTIARSYNCAIVPGSRVRRIRRFLAGQNEGIVAEREYKGVVWAESHQEAELLANSEVKDLTVATNSSRSAPSAIPVDDFVVKAGEVYLVDLKMVPLGKTTKKGLVTLEVVDSAKGKSHRKNELVARSGIFVRDFAQIHALKLKTSRKLVTKIDRNGVYPFKLSHLSENFPIISSKDYNEQISALDKDLKSFRLGMSEIINNYLCVESPVEVAKWVPWDHILKVSNQNGALSYDATASLTLPGHEVPLPKLGIATLKLKSLVRSSSETIELPVVRECTTVVLCDSDISSGERPEVLRLTGGSKTTQPSWIQSKLELNNQDPTVQGIFQLATLVKDKRFGLIIRETQPMKQNIGQSSNENKDMEL
ncbi:similar to Saccharomyces cerevisiae YDR101C ARX1 Shuttling pre-60S factor [Maudiozyma barnettii]|uniref:Probable metalloprotease ARX1 n=1 Tax=Maudiozyma barnettii TaxID=61262 RepID=A0A8H2VI18_9SACH|nr:putative hydrolase [Kazachstania barnettii]CAB4255718.1 similar to Saccharomyces cerevisiae YDR101C ARX1 Shuttling pre-60S factor [Kazachstania barnettii]CAD1784279.1 similar to Saccharomyces cerevisiae YDR101C ARX1 Shuttling pre-60S factor [Kazachstania barnettii]